MPTRSRRSPAPSARNATAPPSCAWKKVRAYRDKVANELGLDPTVIAPKSTLQDISRDPENAATALIAENRWCPWQWELLKPGLE